jgi:hypothetical protein
LFISFGLRNVRRTLRTLTLALRFLGRVSTVEVRMATWKNLSNIKAHETPEAKANMALIKVDFIFT